MSDHDGINLLRIDDPNDSENIVRNVVIPDSGMTIASVEYVDIQIALLKNQIEMQQSLLKKARENINNG